MSLYLFHLHFQLSFRILDLQFYIIFYVLGECFTDVTRTKAMNGLCPDVTSQELNWQAKQEFLEYHYKSDQADSLCFLYANYLYLMYPQSKQLLLSKYLF